MQRLIVVALILSLSHTSVAFAAGPLLESAMRAARRLSQTQGQPNPRVELFGVHNPSDPPNVEEAKRVAAGLGVGRHVKVKTTSGRTFFGHLQEVNEDHIVLLLDHAGKPFEIAYSEVRELGPNLSRDAKVVLWVAAGVTAFMVILAVAITTDDELGS